MATHLKRNWHNLKPWATTAAVLGIVYGGIWGLNALQLHRVLAKAEAQQKKGYNALAAETLDAARADLTTSSHGCTVLLNAYYGAHRADRLEATSQACLDAGIETSDVFLGLAASYELMGRDADSLQLLKQVTKKFEKSPDAYYRMAQIYRRIKSDALAADATYEAAIRTSNNQLSMEALEALSKEKRWDEARRMADKIKDVNTESPEVKLVIARAYLNSGDKTDAQAAAAQARELLARTPAGAKAKLEIAYADVLPLKESIKLDQQQSKQ